MLLFGCSGQGEDPGIPGTPVSGGGAGGTDGHEDDEDPTVEVCTLNSVSRPVLLNDNLAAGSIAVFSFDECLALEGLEASVQIGKRIYSADHVDGGHEIVAYLDELPASATSLALTVANRHWDLDFSSIDVPVSDDVDGFFESFRLLLEDEIDAIDDDELRTFGLVQLSEFDEGIGALDSAQLGELARVLVANQLLPRGLEKNASNICDSTTPEAWTACLKRELRSALQQNVLTIALIGGGLLVPPPIGSVMIAAGSALAATRVLRLLGVMLASTTRVLQATIDAIQFEKSLAPVEANAWVPFEVTLVAPYVGLTDADLSDAPLLEDMRDAFELSHSLALRIVRFFGVSTSVPGFDAAMAEMRRVPASAWTATVEPGFSVQLAGTDRLLLTIEPLGGRSDTGLLTINLHYEHAGVMSGDILLPVLLVETPAPITCDKFLYQDDSLPNLCGNGLLESHETCDSSSADDKQHCEDESTCHILLGDSDAKLMMAEALITGPAEVTMQTGVLGTVPTHVAFGGGSFEAFRRSSQCERTRFTGITSSFDVRASGTRGSVTLSISGTPTVEFTPTDGWEILQLGSSGTPLDLEPLPLALTVQEIDNGDGTYTNSLQLPLTWQLAPGQALEWAGSALSIGTETPAVDLPLGLFEAEDGSHALGLQGTVTLPKELILSLNGMNVIGPVAIPLTTLPTTEGQWQTAIDGPVALTLPPEGRIHWQTGQAIGPAIIPLTAIQLGDWWSPVIDTGVVTVDAGGWVEWGSISSGGTLGGRASGPISVPLTTVTMNGEIINGTFVMSEWLGATTVLDGPTTVSVPQGADLYWEGGLANGPAEVPLKSVWKEIGGWTTILDGPATLDAAGALHWAGGTAYDVAGITLTSQLDGDDWVTVIEGTPSVTVRGSTLFRDARLGAAGGTTLPLTSHRAADGTWYTLMPGSENIVLEGGSISWNGGAAGGYLTVPLVSNPNPDGTWTSILAAPFEVALEAGSSICNLDGPGKGTIVNKDQADGRVVSLVEGVVEYGTCSTFRQFYTYETRSNDGNWTSVRHGSYCLAQPDCSTYLCCGTYTDGITGGCVTP